MNDPRPYGIIREYYDPSIPGTKNPLRRRRPWFHLFAVLVALGTIVVLATSPQGDRIYLSQQVSPAHRFFEHQCDHCHEVSFQLVRRWFGEQEAQFAHACRSCHTTIGVVDHHPKSMIGSLPSDCTNCHQEHRGNRSLLEIHNQHCVACHRQLETSDQPTFEPSIESFAAHPEFRLRSHEPPRTNKHGVLCVADWNPATSQYEDKSHLRFNHQLHLNPAGVAVPPSDPEYSTNNGKVVLQCSNCHKPQRGGAMKPIVFENHCQRCHQLNVSKDLLRPKARQEAKTTGETSPPVGLPHADVETVRAMLRERLVASHVTDADATPDGRQYELVEHRLREILALLFGTPQRQDPSSMTQAAAPVGIGQYCATCHEIRAESGGEPSVSWRVVPPRVPERWLKHARFSHESHETIRCQDCHYRDAPDRGLVANEGSIQRSRSAKDILIPSIATCQLCHGAQGKHAAGADDRCVTCHQYHQHNVVNLPRELRDYLED